MKFNPHLEPATEIARVCKTIRRVGQEMPEGPEIGAEFIQTLKMQGDGGVRQTAVVMRCKFTASPVRPTWTPRLKARRLPNHLAWSAR